MGQTKDVHIYNLVTKDTIEEHIMFLLHEKINMFEMILGELDTILMHLKWDKSFEGQLMDIFIRNSSREEIQRELARLGDQILETRKEIRKQEWNIY